LRVVSKAQPSTVFAAASFSIAVENNDLPATIHDTLFMDISAVLNF
jgi:hypothetical protein